MAKKESESFEFMAWASEKSLLKCSIAAEGAWIRTLTTEMWPNDCPWATNSIQQWARLWRVGVDHAREIIDEFSRNDVCTVTSDLTGDVTLLSRKLEREIGARKENAARQSKYRVVKSNASGNALTGKVEEIYQAYPRKVGPQYAKKCIAKCIARGAEPAYLLEKTRAFADANAWRTTTEQRQYLPHPSTWFNQGRYDDDPSEWGHGAPASKKLMTAEEYEKGRAR